MKHHFDASWRGFKEGSWSESVNVADFIRHNYSPYDGGGDFLAHATARTKRLLTKYEELLKAEHAKGGVLDVSTDQISSLLTFEAGYLDKKDELIVGLQTDAPLKRAINPFGGIRMVEQACEAYGYKLSDSVRDSFRYRTTHNDGVFRVYTPLMKQLRKSGIITGLPDAYGRGRIIGDYRRVALYGANYLMEMKRADMSALDDKEMDDEIIRLREELYRQIDFLDKLKDMARLYSIDISAPASNAREACQWLYFGYLAAVKEQNGAAMSLGRVSTFLDIYIERDIAEGKLHESEAQELIDQLVLKLRMVRQLRTPDYDEIFAGDPNWVTESLGGMGYDGRHLVTKTTLRFMHTLYNLSPAPEPNLTVLWSEKLPKEFKHYALKVSADTSSIQYENDDIMRPLYGDDYGIACCVSAMRIGKQMQYFGARCNIVKVLLLAINGGRDEITGEQIAPVGEVMNGVLDYNKVMESLGNYSEWLAGAYVNTMNIIHYMHDKYAYEKIQMALHDTSVERLMAFGMAGLSVIADSLSAIKYAKVIPHRNQLGVTESFEIKGDYPKFGNDDDRVDNIAVEVAKMFYGHLVKHKIYRNSIHTLSLLTITSNIVYGKKTGATPDGRLAGEPFAPGASPMHGRETHGALASLNSVAKLPYDCCRDGISNTFSITPSALGDDPDNAINIVEGYFKKGAHHLNVNVLNRETLEDAVKHPENYPNLTIRVSGYAVNFIKLSHKHQLEVIARTFHQSL